MNKCWKQPENLKNLECTYQMYLVFNRTTLRNMFIQEKKEKIWLSPMTKSPTPAEMSKGQSDNTKNATKSSITQRLRIDLGRQKY